MVHAAFSFTRFSDYFQAMGRVCLTIMSTVSLGYPIQDSALFGAEIQRDLAFQVSFIGAILETWPVVTALKNAG